MIWLDIHSILESAQDFVSVCGVLIILSGVLVSLYQYLYFYFTGALMISGEKMDIIRGNLGRTLILGLEFIVAADLIGTTTTPDYYAVGMLAIIVAIRTLLSYSISRELPPTNS